MRLRPLLLAAGAVLILASSAVADTRAKAPVPPSAVPQSQDAFETTLAEAAADLNKGDNAHAREVLERAWRSPVFAKNAPDVRHAVLLTIVSLASDTRDWAGAKAAITPASEMPIADAADWISRLDIATYGRDPEDAVHALTVLAQRFPTALSDLKDDSLVYWRTRAAGLPDGKAKQFALTDALFKAPWTPSDPFLDMSDLRMSYALGLIQHGRLEEARIVARAATNPETVITMRADKRFDPLGERFSPKAATLARQAEVTALLAKHGDRLSGQVAKAETLLALHRPREALEVIDAAIARTTAAADAFVDQEAQLAWAHDLRNDALKALNRQEEALEALAAGARVPEKGRPNVNQTLNLAVAQLHAARPKAALATMGTIRLDQMSPYGRSVALQIKVCAQAALGDREAALAGLKEMRAIGDEAKNNTLVALLCLGDLDGAAALVIERLQAEDLRGRTLLTLQGEPRSDYPTAYELDREAKLEALRKRPDVLAAVAPVGRIEHYRPEDLWPQP